LSATRKRFLVATACSKPPPGRARWTLELLTGELIKLTEHEDLSRETVRRRLAENHLKPWRKDMWCVPRSMANTSPAWRTCSILYAEAPDQAAGGLLRREPDPAHREVRQPIRAKPGQLERYDCEYRRNGTVNLFVFLRRPPILAQGESHDRGQPGLRPLHARIWSTFITQTPR